MPRHVFALVVALGFLAGWLVPPSYSAEAIQPDVKPAPERTLTDDDYRLFKTLVDVMDQVERNYVKDIDRKEILNAAIKGVLQKLDPYSNYIPPENMSDFRTSIENQFGGIGILIGLDEDRRLKVISPLVGTPAYRAGVQSGDRIVKIEGKSTEGFSTDDAQHALKGKAGSEVSFSVRRAGVREPLEVTVKREVIQVETVMGDQRNPDDSWDFMLDHEKRIGYIRITAFSRDTAQQVRRAMEQLKRQGLRGLVVDLRFDPGGLLDSAVEISDLFISEGRIVSTKNRDDELDIRDAKKPGTFEGFPMAILVNRYSASASEIVSACLQDHHRAVIIGERTWGKGSVQNVIPLEGGGALKLTIAGYFRPSGKNIHRLPNLKDSDDWGVQPDKGYQTSINLARLIAYRRERDIVPAKSRGAVHVPIEAPPEDNLAPFVDTQLEKALGYINSQLKRAGKGQLSSQ